MLSGGLIFGHLMHCQSVLYWSLIQEFKEFVFFFFPGSDNLAVPQFEITENLGKGSIGYSAGSRHLSLIPTSVPLIKRGSKEEDRRPSEGGLYRSRSMPLLSPEPEEKETLKNYLLDAKFKDIMNEVCESI